MLTPQAPGRMYAFWYVECRVNPAFWTVLTELLASSTVVIDRPRHSAHPRRPELIYPYDYGYLEGTTAGDGQGIDVWLGSGDHTQITGILCTVDLYKRDAELKYVLANISGFRKQRSIPAFPPGRTLVLSRSARQS